MEEITDDAFMAAEMDVIGRIVRQRFRSWILDFLNITERTPSVGLREFLKRFNALKRKEPDVAMTAGQIALQKEAEKFGMR